MNYRFKLFKADVSEKDQEIYAKFKRIRNEITIKLRILKTRYFREKKASVKFPMAYWNFITEATNPVRRNQIGPLKREDGSLGVSDKEKAHPKNKFFGTFGNRLERGSHKNIQRNDNKRNLVPPVSDINVF